MKTDKNKTSWEIEFDNKFPEFIGSGAPFPIFRETPNRNHLKTFIKDQIHKAKLSTLDMAIGEEMVKMTTLGLTFTCQDCYNQKRQEIIEIKSKLEKEE